MTTLLLPLLLTPISAFSLPAGPVSLDLEYIFRGQPFCKTTLKMEPGAEHLICEGRIDEKRAEIKAKVEPELKNEHLFSMRIETIDDAGKIEVIGNKQIMLYKEETGSMSMEEVGYPESFEEIRARVRKE